MTLDAKLDLHAIEEVYQKTWEDSEISAFKENDDQKPLYVIDTPPPFPTGEFHTGSTLNWVCMNFM